jgi:acyl-CoA thioesterase FadM
MNNGSTDAPITYRGVVYPWQCDHMGHMNVMWYTGKFDEATWNLFASIGITPTYIRESNNGVAGVQQNIAYKKELAPAISSSYVQPSWRSAQRSCASCTK